MDPYNSYVLITQQPVVNKTKDRMYKMVSKKMGMSQLVQEERSKAAM